VFQWSALCIAAAELVIVVVNARGARDQSSVAVEGITAP
jgi:hypothetical protein